MGYPFEDLDDKQFERCTVQCMKKLFGPGVQSFAAGRDGGRDALFNGTAMNFPSPAMAWSGRTVGQAKHTSATNAHFSDPDFSGDGKSAVLMREVARIRRLVDDRQINNYILFANRRLGGVVGPRITNWLAAATGLAPERVFLAGIEFLDDMLHEHPDILRLARIDPVDGPLLVSSRDLAEIILAISDELETSGSGPDSESGPVDRVTFEEKNRLNSMSQPFADLLEKRYLGHTRKIDDFLADPSNEAVLRSYESTVDEFQLKIIAKRTKYQSFDDVFNYLFDVLVRRDGVLGRNRPLVRAMLFYMYWHCDIGLAPDAAA